MFGSTILISTLCMLGLSFGFAVVLGFAHSKLKVKEDPQVEEVEAVLPGVNCGACGFSGCHDFAVNVVNQTASLDGCVPGGKDVAEAVASILGKSIDVESSTLTVAVVHCGAGWDEKKDLGDYSGIETCRGSELSMGGYLSCDHGCLGFGDCERACPYSAIEMVEGLPQIDLNKCTACGECVKACPRDIISIETIAKGSQFVKVACNSEQKGSDTRKQCSVGCIACGLCEKFGPEGVFNVENNLSRMDYDKVNPQSGDFDEIIEKCPPGCIVELVSEVR